MRSRLYHPVRRLGGETATVLAAIVLSCGISLVLFGLIALIERGMQRWYEGPLPVGGVI
jgi:ABC-type nitrate/sulfonate/bicarbonate transport system permease component